MHAINYTNARKHFTEIMKRVTDNAEPVRIIRRGAPDIVMVDAEEYEALMDTPYLFSNLVNIVHINDSMKQAERGEFVEVEY